MIPLYRDSRRVPPDFGERAGAVRRVAASLYEGLLIAALALAIGFALLPLLGSQRPLSPDQHPPPLTPATKAIWFSSLVLALGCYCIWGWSRGRRTLAMKAWRIAIASPAGVDIGVSRAALRYLAWWIGPALAISAYAGLRPSGHGRLALALLGVNYAWALLDSDRQFLHDRIAGTRLVVD